MRKIETVFQLDACGCWLASASMLTGMKYSLLREDFSFRDDEASGRSAKPLRELLMKYGVRVEEKCTRVSSKNTLQSLECDALVYGKVHFRDGNRFKIAKRPPGHWMVWDAKERVIRDPAGFDGGIIVELRNYRRVLERP